MTDTEFCKWMELMGFKNNYQAAKCLQRDPQTIEKYRRVGATYQVGLMCAAKLLKIKTYSSKYLGKQIV